MTPYAKALQEWRRAYLEAALAEAGSVTKASKMTGIHRSVFYRRLDLTAKTRARLHDEARLDALCS